MKSFKVLLSLSLVIILISAINPKTSLAVMFGENSFLPADNEDLKNYPFMDEDLKNIVRRTVRVHVGDKRDSTGFLVGTDGKCNKLLTAKHNMNYPYADKFDANKGKIKSPEETVFIRSGNGEKSIVLDKRKNVTKRWSIKNEATILNLNPLKSINCPKVPVIPRKNFATIKSCALIGYPTGTIFDNDGKVIDRTNYSGVINRKTGKQYLDGKRAITYCSIMKNVNGIIIHNCDSIPGMSGGPIVCLANNKWSYVAVNNGGSCKKSGRFIPNCYSLKKGPDFLSEVAKEDRVYGSAGSIVVDDFQ